MSQLRECPFCGQLAELQIAKSISYVKCCHCEAEGPSYAKEHTDLAALNWNTRSTHPQQDVHGLVAALASISNFWINKDGMCGGRAVEIAQQALKSYQEGRS